MSLWLYLSCLVGLSSAYTSQCPFPEKRMTDVDLEALLGVWYPKERHGVQVDTLLKCPWIEYQPSEENLLSVISHGTDPLENEDITFDFSINLKQGFSSGNLPISGATQSDFYILATDYVSYAVTYSCTASLNIAQLRYAVVSSVETRDPQGSLSDEAQAIIEDVIASAGLNRTFFSSTDFEGCGFSHE